MAKPAYHIFVGIGAEGLSEEDKRKLPVMLREVHDFNRVDIDELCIAQGFLFERFDFGRHDTDDPGDFAGFGVEVLHSCLDFGTEVFCLDDISKKAQNTLAMVTGLWQEWGINVKPKILSFCSYA